MLMLPFLIVVVRAMPPSFESTRSEGDHEQPPSEENGEYQGQRTAVHKPFPKSQISSFASHLAVTEITGAASPSNWR